MTRYEEGLAQERMPLRTIKRQLFRRRKLGRRRDTKSSQGLEQSKNED
jgi:hypothetical protein